MHVKEFEAELVLGVLTLSTSRWNAAARLSRLHALCAGWWHFLKLEHWSESKKQNLNDGYFKFDSSISREDLIEIEKQNGFAGCLDPTPNDPEATIEMFYTVHDTMRQTVKLCSKNTVSTRTHTLAFCRF